MAVENIIIPFMVGYLLGSTTDIRTYEPLDRRGNTLFDKKDYVESPLDTLNSTYHVLQNEKMPYSILGVPTGMVHLIKREDIYSTMYEKDIIKRSANFPAYNTAEVAIFTKLKKVARSIKQDAKPVTNWMKNVPTNHTHYISEIQYGGASLAIISVSSNIPSDVQVIRRILTDVMGVSGNVGTDILDLWQKALKAIKESPDVRGDISTGLATNDANVKRPVTFSTQDYLRILNDFPKFVVSNDVALNVILRPLHDLDKKYPLLEKNLEVEKDIQRVDDMFDDIKYTRNNLDNLIGHIIEPIDKIDQAYKKLENMRKILFRLRNLSPYGDTNRSAIDAALKQYQSGLENGSETYYLMLKKIREDIGLTCDNDFIAPTRGFLKVLDSEVVKKGKVDGGLEECQELCSQDKRCRAVGYADKVPKVAGVFTEEEKQCWIYYRSTDTATIYTPKGFTDGMAIYDRKCKKCDDC